MLPSPPPPPVIALSGVTKRFGQHTALQDVHLQVASGEVFGVIGESGAGKSTLLNLLTGAERPTEGSVGVLGHDVAELDGTRLRALRRQLGVVFQGVNLLANRTVRANVGLPLDLARTGRAQRRADAARVEEVLEFVGLADRADHYPAQLSGGQQQRVGIARALATRPRLLLCDEPTSSLDATTADGILRVLLDVRERLSTTVVVVTHDLHTVRAICDRVALFEHGGLQEIITVDRRELPEAQSYLDRARKALEA